MLSLVSPTVCIDVGVMVDARSILVDVCDAGAWFGLYRYESK